MRTGLSNAWLVLLTLAAFLYHLRLISFRLVKTCSSYTPRFEPVRPVSMRERFTIELVRHPSSAGVVSSWKTSWLLVQGQNFRNLPHLGTHIPDWPLYEVREHHADGQVIGL